MIKEAGSRKLVPFSRDELFISLYKSCGHRSSALNDATALVNTVIHQLINKRPAQPIFSKDEIFFTTHQALKRFDKVAAITYEAYHQPVKAQPKLP